MPKPLENCRIMGLTFIYGVEDNSITGECECLNRFIHFVVSRVKVKIYQRGLQALLSLHFAFVSLLHASQAFLRTISLT